MHSVSLCWLIDENDEHNSSAALWVMITHVTVQN